MAFSSFSPTLMSDLLSLLAVVFVIGVIDNLPNFFMFGSKRHKKKKIENEEDEWVLVRRKN